MGVRVEVAGKSDIGCVRGNNEDNFGYDSRYGIYVVCDGMGGQAAGEVASKIAVDTILSYYRTKGNSETLPASHDQSTGLTDRALELGRAIQYANRAVHEASAAQPSQAGMGTTVAAVCTAPDRTAFSIAHAGDSRIYRVRNGEIEQLTNDHSLVMEQVRLGLISREEARLSNMQNVITRALGADAEVEVDLADSPALDGDVLVLCSDGLTRHVPEDSIAEAVSGTSDLKDACSALIEAARDGGGEDNITCLLLRFAHEPWYKKILRTFGGGGTPKWQNSI